MPEGDTVWRTAHRLDEVFAGRLLTLADLRWPGLSTYQLAGTPTREVVPRGKHILHRLESGWTIHSHLRMDGSWRIERRSGRAPSASPRLRAVLGTDAYLALGWSLGMLDVVRTTEEHTLVGHLGPDILGSDWDADGAVANLRAPSVPLADALLDQTNLAGIGTMWASEGLFVARLNPFADASEIEPAALRALLDRTQRLMRASCASAVPSSTGSRVPSESTYVHGRRHRPCRRCGTLVAMRFSGPATRERTIYYCPACQGVPNLPATGS